MNRLETLHHKVKLSKREYRWLLSHWQLDLLTLQQTLVRGGARVILNIEGMDAAGKGGAVRRLVERLDPRGYKVYRIGPPADAEQNRHYLYRFWTRIPAPGELVIFDRSWYGRVLVERVEGLAEPAAWQRAYREISDFERTLANDGVIIVKLWFHIDPDEQLRRFEDRMSNPFKSWKMTDEDWRNRGKWDAYIQAAEDMFQHTHTETARWTVIPANSKHYARLQAIRTLVEALVADARRRGENLPELTLAPFPRPG